MKNLSPYTNRFLQRKKAAEKKKYWLRLTNTCNNNCIFCLDRQLQDGTVRSLKDIKNELQRGRRQGAKKAILSGGDPTLHPDFLAIVLFAKRAGYQEIQVVTNGRMFYYRQFLEEAVKNGVTEITFSMHGHTRNLYEKQSRIKGSFKQAMGGLFHALKVRNLIVNIDVVINKINYKYLEQILRFFIGLGVTEFDLLQVVPFGNAWQNREEVFYNLKKALPFLKKAFGLQFEFSDIYIWTNRFPPQYLEGFEELIQHPVKLYDEIRGRKGIFMKFINEDKIMPCFGRQCNYCFLEKFCIDLLELKRERVVCARKYPLCLKFNNAPLAKFKAVDNIHLEKFLSFYIRYRYFLKSLRCNSCKFFNQCDGAPIDFLRQNGFKALRVME